MQNGLLSLPDSLLERIIRESSCYGKAHPNASVCKRHYHVNSRLAWARTVLDLAQVAGAVAAYG